MANATSIYEDISARTGGDIYIGVVGPVRTGKSTFIAKFMDELVLPNIDGKYDKERARDEMPQSAAGKTVMTTEPKFVPDEAVELSVGGNAKMRVKMVDCVGYVVDGALGQSENGEPRMVRTPWSDEPMPFGEAAEMGTKKVICDHSTIAVLVTCDGSVCELEREKYVSAEERVANELMACGKPFAILLNSAHPESEEAAELARSLEEKYSVPVALVNCLYLDKEDINHILELILSEFPVRSISVDIPSWAASLDESHQLVRALRADILSVAKEIGKVGQIEGKFAALAGKDGIVKVSLDEVDMGSGKAKLSLALENRLYYKTLSELTGLDIDGDDKLIDLICSLSAVKAKYEKIEAALADVEEKGYGIVVPDIEDLSLEEPKLVRHSGGYGVHLKASAPSVHMLKATIQTEIDPVVGSEQQSEELVKFLLSEFEEDPKKIWETNIFGKTLYELVTEGLHAKLSNIPDDARTKLTETLGRIINEGSGGLICIIL